MSNSTPIAPDLDSLSLQRLMASLSLLQINYDDVNFDAGVAGSGASVWQMPETRNAFGFDVEGFSSLDRTLQELLSPAAVALLDTSASVDEINDQLLHDYDVGYRGHLETFYPNGILFRDTAGPVASGGNGTGVSLTATQNNTGRYVVFVDGLDPTGANGEGLRDAVLVADAILDPTDDLLNAQFANDFYDFGGFVSSADGTFGEARISLEGVPARIAQVMAYIQFVNKVADDIALDQNISKLDAYSKIDTVMHSAGSAGLIGNAWFASKGIQVGQSTIVNPFDSNITGTIGEIEQFVDYLSIRVQGDVTDVSPGGVDLENEVVIAGQHLKNVNIFENVAGLGPIDAHSVTALLAHFKFVEAQYNTYLNGANGDISNTNTVVRQVNGGSFYFVSKVQVTIDGQMHSVYVSDRDDGIATIEGLAVLSQSNYDAALLSGDLSSLQLDQGYVALLKHDGELSLDDLKTGFIQDSQILLNVEQLVSVNGVMVLTPGTAFLGSDARRNLPPEARCFGEGTVISMADGSKKAIEKIQVGDWVAAFDEEGVVRPGLVTKTFVSPSEDLRILDGTTFVTSQHPFLTQDGDFLPIAEIVAQSLPVFDANGAPVRVRSLERIDTMSPT